MLHAGEILAPRLIDEAARWTLLFITERREAAGIAQGTMAAWSCWRPMWKEVCIVKEHG